LRTIALESNFMVELKVQGSKGVFGDPLELRHFQFFNLLFLRLK
jgi:hypothetical protein